MEGKRSQGVLHKYLQEAAKGLTVKGVALADRLYVPEPFSEATHVEAAQRRRAAACGSNTCRTHRSWSRTKRGSGWGLVRAVVRGQRRRHRAQARLIMTALIRARREHTYEIDAASMLLTSAQWIPVDGVHELPLIDALVAAHRRFLKPLRYDARRDVAFPNVLLLDSGQQAVPLHVVSPFVDSKERRARETAISEAGSVVWSWRTTDPITALPAVSAQRSE